MERQVGGSTSKTPLVTPSASPPPTSASFSNASTSSSPFKRPRLSSRPPSAQDTLAFDQAREQSTRRMLDVWSQLAERYSRRIDEDDIVDLVTGKVIKDRGVLKNMETKWEFGRFADTFPVPESRVGSTTEEDEEEEPEEEGRGQTRVGEESDDELDSFAEVRRAESSQTAKPVEAEAEAEEPAVTLPVNLPRVQALDPNNVDDAADLRDFLEAENKRKEQMGSEDECEDSSVHDGGTEDGYGYFSEGATTDVSSVLGNATPVSEEGENDATNDKATSIHSAGGSDDELDAWGDDGPKQTSTDFTESSETLQRSSTIIRSLRRSSSMSSPTKKSSTSSVLRQLQTPPSSQTTDPSPLPYTGEYFDYVVSTSSPPTSSLPPSSPPGGYYPTPSSLSPVQTRQSSSSTSSSKMTYPDSKSSQQKITRRKSPVPEIVSEDAPRATRSTVPYLNLAEVLRASRNSLSPRKRTTSSNTTDKNTLPRKGSSSSLARESKPSRSRSRSRPREASGEQHEIRSAKSKGKQKATEHDFLDTNDNATTSTVPPKSMYLFDGIEIPQRTSNLKRKRADSSSDTEIQLRASTELPGSENTLNRRVRTPMPQKEHRDSFDHSEYDHNDLARLSHPSTSRSKSLPRSTHDLRGRKQSSKSDNKTKDSYSDEEERYTISEPDSPLSRKRRSQSRLESVPPHADPYHAPYPQVYDRNQTFQSSVPVYDPRAQYIISQAVHQLSALFSNPWPVHPPDAYPLHQTYPLHHQSPHPTPSHGQSRHLYTPSRYGRSRSVLNLLPDPSSSSLYNTPTHRPHRYPDSYDPNFSRGTLPPSSPEPDSSPTRPNSSQTPESSPSAARHSTHDISDSSPEYRRRTSSLVSRSHSRGRRVSFKEDVTKIGEGGKVVAVEHVVYDMDISPRPRTSVPSTSIQQKLSRPDLHNTEEDISPTRLGHSKGEEKATYVADDGSLEDEPSSHNQRTRRGLTPGPSGPRRKETPRAQAEPEDIEQVPRGRTPTRGRNNHGRFQRPGSQKGQSGSKNVSRGRSQSRG
ncbi:hypothetical protein K435DRAFT_866967 [Dendrothele bispora CBS 962.96]|uniref:Uncharacterized protein n=1 Tax=Dendrothele bispora (strain CBS 962.96) TaxID=1314807 RepID=A0A4S8LGU2_DENBC|nr:hypothetical protein K435DRAFT_866967 [Dendrothele bispora CBS 962.96]